MIASYDIVSNMGTRSLSGSQVFHAHSVGWQYGIGIKFPYPTKEVSMGRIFLVVILLLSAVRVDAFTINFDAPQSVSTVTTR
jgi:hypothetical protein